MSITAANFAQIGNTTSKLWPETDFHLLFSGNSGIHYCLLFSENILLYFGNRDFLENLCFLSFSVHFNESALMEMFIMTVRSFYVFIKNSVLTCKNQSDLSFVGENTVFHVLFVNDKFHLVKTGDKGFYFLDICFDFLDVCFVFLFWTLTFSFFGELL